MTHKKEDPAMPTTPQEDQLTTGDAPQKSPAASTARKPLLAKVLIVIALVLTILFVVLALTKEDETTTTSAPSSVAVTVTSSGFQPSSVQIKAGDTVTWTNTDKKAHQIAADPYPVNDSIPNFDSTVILNQNDAHTHTFDVPGTYTYHDELNPLKKSFHGTIVVQ